jgi:hypothetical protein
MKKAGKPRDQGVHSIDSGAGDGDVNVGSRARGCCRSGPRGRLRLMGGLGDGRRCSATP